MNYIILWIKIPRVIHKTTKMDVKECRICFDGPLDNNTESLLSPCKCDGTMKWVHSSCLNKTNHSQCPICLHNLNVKSAPENDSYCFFLLLLFVEFFLMYNMVRSDYYEYYNEFFVDQQCYLPGAFDDRVPPLGAFRFRDIYLDIVDKYRDRVESQIQDEIIQILKDVGWHFYEQFNTFNQCDSTLCYLAKEAIAWLCLFSGCIVVT